MTPSFVFTFFLPILQHFLFIPSLFPFLFIFLSFLFSIFLVLHLSHPFLIFLSTLPHLFLPLFLLTRIFSPLPCPFHPFFLSSCIFSCIPLCLLPHFSPFLLSYNLFYFICSLISPSLPSSSPALVFIFSFFSFRLLSSHAALSLLFVLSHFFASHCQTITIFCLFSIL